MSDPERDSAIGDDTWNGIGSANDATDLLAPGEVPGARAILAVHAGSESEDTEILAFAIRNALMSALTSFEELSPKSASEVDVVSGPPTTIARAVGADDVLESTVACQARDCSVELRRVRGSDGSVERDSRQQVPRDDLLTAARAIGAGLRQLYPGERLRPGHVELEVAPEDYTSYVEIKRSFDARPETGVMLTLLDQLETLRRRSPRFVEVFLLEADIAFSIYHQTREEAPLTRALDLMGQGQDLAPTAPRVLHMRSYIEINSDRLDEAEKTLAELERLVPGDVRVLDRRARRHAGRGTSSSTRWAGVPGRRHRA